MSSSSSENGNGNIWKTIQPFVFGGSAGMFATCCIQPIDMIKVQIQFSSKKGSAVSPFHIAKQMIGQHGIRSLYNGLSAGLLRQATYTTGRLGIFYKITDEIKKRKGQISFHERALTGLFAGAIGATLGNPCDLSLVRIQQETVTPLAERKGYTNVFNTISRIVKEEGILTLWRGSLPTVCRAMALNVGMLATYDQTKDIVSQYAGENSKITNFTASAVAGFFASALSLPFDFLKTRIQRQKIESGIPRRGFADMAKYVVATEGIGAFYKGFTTYYFRIAPHAMITLLTVEVLKKYLSEPNLTSSTFSHHQETELDDEIEGETE